LSVAWVLESIKKGALQLEDTYEIRRTVKDYEENAPKRARYAMHVSSAHQQHQTGRVLPSCSYNSHGAELFHGMSAVLYGDFPSPGPPMSDIFFLLQRGGCTVYPSIDQLIAGEVSKGYVEETDGHHHKRQFHRWVSVELFIAYRLPTCYLRIRASLYHCRW